MAIQMIPNSRLGQEAAALKAEKAGEAVKGKDSGTVSEGVKGGGLAGAESTGAAGETVRVSQARRAADVGQAAETGKDGKTGGGTVRRRAMDQYIPEEKAESFGHYQAVPDENGKGEQAKSSPAEESAVKKAGNQEEDAGGQSQKIQKLKLKKKQLKEQIKAETDPKKAGELKRKLAEVEKELKGKGGLNF